MGSTGGGEPDQRSRLRIERRGDQERRVRQGVAAGELGPAATAETKAAGFAALADPIGVGRREQTARIASGRFGRAEPFAIQSGLPTDAGDRAAIGVPGIGHGVEPRIDRCGKVAAP